MPDTPHYRFPGMDPWLEAPGIWGPVHNRLIIYLADDLNAQLRPAYVAVPGGRLIVEELEAPHRNIYPDVIVTERHRVSAAAASTCAVEEPIIVHIASDPRPEAFLEIRDPRAGNLLVTVVEILSPGNKQPGHDGRRQYLQKQAEVLAADVNLVEIDLLRGGEETVALRPGLRPAGPYRIVLRRAGVRDRAEVYPVPLNRRLPRIRVPLRKGDPDAHADLQALVEKVYCEGSCDLLIDYRRPPEPPLSVEDAAWARGVLDAGEALR